MKMVWYAVSKRAMVVYSRRSASVMLEPNRNGPPWQATGLDRCASRRSRDSKSGYRLESYASCEVAKPHL